MTALPHPAPKAPAPTRSALHGALIDALDMLRQAEGQTVLSQALNHALHPALGPDLSATAHGSAQAGRPAGAGERLPAPGTPAASGASPAADPGDASTTAATPDLLLRSPSRPPQQAGALEPQRLSPAHDCRSGHVTLAGAGPGDPDLLTVKALRAIEAADVVLHDQLVSADILALIPAAAERIDVGKACGHHRYNQAAIIELMLALARQGRRVLRLKGGDPHIFGRGGEEAQALAAAGIAFDFIPGISAAQAAASCAGIPLTHRDHARAVVYATAHMREDGTASGGSSGEPDWAALARPAQTLVLYMGLNRLDWVCARLQTHGLAADTPAAVVERASQPGQRTVCGTLASLPAATQDAAVRGPALIIVGSVVSLATVLAPSARNAASTGAAS